MGGLNQESLLFFSYSHGGCYWAYRVFVFVFVLLTKHTFAWPDVSERIRNWDRCILGVHGRPPTLDIGLGLLSPSFPLAVFPFGVLILGGFMVSLDIFSVVFIRHSSPRVSQSQS